jgi:hypothetical protein
MTLLDFRINTSKPMIGGSSYTNHEALAATTPIDSSLVPMM